MLAPLQGKEILITRGKSQSQPFADLVIKLGGKPIEIPLLHISCKRFDEEKLHLSDYQWIIFTSANGVHCFFKGLNEKLLDGSIQFAVVGHKTENALRQYGVSANFVPSVYNAEVMAAEFLEQTMINGSILIVKGNKSRKVLQESFLENEIAFDEIITYETTTNTSAKALLTTYFNQSYPDFITFTSPSSVEAFIEMVASDKIIKQAKRIPCVCIGSTTEVCAKNLGFIKTLAPNQFTIEGMIDKIARYIKEKG